MASVVKEWVSADNISMKQQTVLLSCIRGCDGQSKHDISKKFIRKIRDTVLFNAAASDTTFMKDAMTLDEVREYAEDSDKYPIHFAMHLCHCCEIIGYKYPDVSTRGWFNSAYHIIVDSLHLKPETEAECDFRLRDGVNTPYTEDDTIQHTTVIGTIAYPTPGQLPLRNIQHPNSFLH